MTVNALHPGPVRSGFGMDGDMTGIVGLGNRMIRPFEISPTAGARTSIFLAADPSVEGKTGGYYVRSRPGHIAAPCGTTPRPSACGRRASASLPGSGSR